MCMDKIRVDPNPNPKIRVDPNPNPNPKIRVDLDGASICSVFFLSSVQLVLQGSLQ